MSAYSRRLDRNRVLPQSQHMVESISERTKRLFEVADAFTNSDGQSILAEHSASGRLQSGITIVRVVKAFAERSCEALDESLASVAIRVDHWGRKWRNMLALVDQEIDRHIDAAPPKVAKLTSVAGPNHEALSAPLIEDIRKDLHSRLADYREGWTAPQAKPWRERNAVIYAVLLLAAGAGVSEGSKWLFSKFETGSSSSSAISAAHPKSAP